MGWNQVFQARPHPVWAGVPDGAYFYFVHSFYARPSEPRHSVGETDYGSRFTCAVGRDNILQPSSTREERRAWPRAVPKLPALESPDGFPLHTTFFG